MVLGCLDYNLTFSSPLIISTIIPHFSADVKEKMHLS